MYGGEPYTRLGVVSNGYLVLGGGTAADIVFTPQTFPNAAPAEQRGRAVLERPQPGRGRRDPHRHV